MWKSEEDFPRGKPHIKKSENLTNVGIQSSVKLTKSQVTNNGELVSKKRKHPSTPTNYSRAKYPRKEVKQNIIETPLHQDLSTDLCVLGCVRHVFEYGASVSLPGNMMATLPITDISPSYTKQLKALVCSDDLETAAEELKSAEDFLKPGMLLPVVVRDIIEDKQQQKRKIILSSDPTKINTSIQLQAVEDGQLLFGSISSVEDHGYNVDLGIKGLQAFLIARDAVAFIQACNGGSSLCIGQPVWCVLKMADKAGIMAGESRVVNITIDPQVVENSRLSAKFQLNSYLPGMNLKGIVSSISENGLHVTVFNYLGVVHSSQLPKSSSHYTVGQEIDLKVLYLNPTTKMLHLSGLPKLLKFNGTPINCFGNLQIGSIVQAKVAWVHKKKGVYFKLPDNVKGFSALCQLSDEDAENPDLTQYQIDTSFQCRVLGFNYMECMALVTLKKSILQQKFLRIEDISVGEVVEAIVKDVHQNGIVVKISKGIFSFIPCLHLADVPIKHPEKKFERGMKLKCRVLKVDLKKTKVLLTHKRSIVKTKYPILSDYNQIRPHMELEGYIIAVKENVVVVSFYNDVKGYVTPKDMSTEEVEDPSSMFYKGQVIRCRVVYFNIQDKKLKLSFNFGERIIIAEKQVLLKDDTSNLHLFGKLVAAKILNVESNGYRILLNNKQAAHLPFLHLSDFHEVQELKKLAFKPGHQLKKLTFFNHKQRIFMTMKESFIQAAEENTLIGQFEDLKSGMLVPAVIKNHQDFGMFLELANGHIGLCPAKTLSYLQPSNLQELFQPGQSVIARLNKIDSEKKRFLGSIRLDECFEGGVGTSLHMLKSYLLARQETLDILFSESGKLSLYSKLKVGDIVEVTISSVLKKGILGDLESGAKALATKYHYGGIDPKVGSKYHAVILFIDPLTPCVELTLEPKVVKCVATRKENSKSQLKMDQILKADTLLVKPEFMLMSLRGHGSGKFVYVPIKQHMNDVDVNKPYKLGTFADVVIKNSFDEFQLAVLKVHDPEVAEKERAERINFKTLAKHDMAPGMVVEAKIRAIHPLQINIIANKFHGRIHITEVSDKVEEGKNPLHKFHPEQIVQAKIIGLRDVKKQSYLPLTNPGSKRTLLECSLKASKLLNQSNTDLLIPKLDVKEGDKVFVYVIKVSSYRVWVQVSLNQQGYIDFFHLSHDTNVLNDVNTHFQTGNGYLATVLEHESDDKLVLSLIGNFGMQVTEGEDVIAQVTSFKTGICLFVKLAGGELGVIKEKPTLLHYVGQYIKCRVNNVEEESGRYLLSTVEKRELPLRRMRKRKLSVNEDKCKVKEIIRQKKLLKKMKSQGKQEKSDDQGDSGVDIAKNSSDTDEENVTVKHKKVDSEVPRLDIQGFSWDGEIAKDKEHRIFQTAVATSKFFSSIYIYLPKRIYQDIILNVFQYEKSQLEGKIAPQSANDFEKLVLQSPNSSVIWLRFMAYHIELGEIEKARVVAEKALNTITFREEQEKLNVWLAYLNMETMYGDSGDVKKLLERAVSYNNPLDIYLKMTDIYVSNGKTEEAEQLYNLIIRKYKHDKLVWKSYGQFLYKSGRVQFARNLLQRSIQVLDKKKHVEVITRFANLEFTDGDTERGRTMFENLIASYPGRTDLWSVYVDMVAKVGDIEGARLILERAVKQKLNAKKLSFLIQKFMRFEETHGTEDQVQRIKDLALTLLDS
ncbi:unnamed protein product [Lymnaea stagnalis]|uniref:S1 motif domain-containing protein n=1 Tax=Lymnaea stagnalis TaxID=6523 RepID=A0AAV2I2J2_LYMST